MRRIQYCRGFWPRQTTIQAVAAMEQQLERFLDKILFGDGCWFWTAAKSKEGYGTAWWNGRPASAHRLMHELFVGPITGDGKSDQICVCHKCDQPSCVKPTHLFLGSHSDNMIDMYAKGRGNRPTGDKHHARLIPGKVAGGRNGRASVSEEDIRAIRYLSRNKCWSRKQIREYLFLSIGDSQMSRIILGRHWQGVE